MVCCGESPRHTLPLINVPGSPDYGRILTGTKFLKYDRNGRHAKPVARARDGGAHQDDRPLCQVCLEGDDEGAGGGGGELVHGGCGCRGIGGVRTAPPACLPAGRGGDAQDCIECGTGKYAYPWMRRAAIRNRTASTAVPAHAHTHRGRPCAANFFCPPRGEIAHRFKTHA